MNTYYIHDNGGRPFKVIISPDKILIYKKKYSKKFDFTKDEEEGIDYKYILKMEIINFKNIFLGKNDISFDPDISYEKANSIIIELPHKKAIYIGSSIYEFNLLADILDFYNPIGNNDVPYPYLIDKLNNIYLLIEDIIMINAYNIDYKNHKINPYYEYYDKMSYVSNKIPGFENYLTLYEIDPNTNFRKKKDGIVIYYKDKSKKSKKLEINSSFYSIRADPLKHYNWNKKMGVIERYLLTKNKQTVILSKKDYININNIVLRYYNLMPLKKRILQKRF